MSTKEGAVTSTDAKPPEDRPETSADAPGGTAHRPPTDAEQRRQDEREEQSFPGSDPPGVGGPGII